jgi:fatty-acyl-CoA synthase
VCAAVVGAGYIDDDALVAALDGYARTHLAGYKRPKEYRVVEALPRTATGKVRRLSLAELVSSAE